MTGRELTTSQLSRTTWLLYTNRSLQLLWSSSAQYIFPDSRQGLTQKLREISVGVHRPKLEVLFVQPFASESDRCIDFETFARYVGAHGDPLRRRFGESLLRWRSSAGTLDSEAEIQHGDRVKL